MYKRNKTISLAHIQFNSIQSLHVVCALCVVVWTSNVAMEELNFNKTQNKKLVVEIIASYLFIYFIFI